MRLADVPNVNPNAVAGVGAALLRSDDTLPRTQSYSFTVQQRLPYQMVLEAGYVGSKSDHLLDDRTKLPTSTRCPSAPC